MFNKSLEKTLKAIFRYGNEQHHEFITVEHLLLYLLDNVDASRVLQACGTDIKKLRKEVSSFLSETAPKMPEYKKQQAQPTLAFQRVLQRAIIQTQSLGRAEVTGADLLSAIFGEQESQAVYFLNQENATRFAVSNYLAQGLNKMEPTSFQHSSDLSGGLGVSMHPQTESLLGEKSMLERYAVNLNEAAKAGKIDPLIAREDELQRVIQVLSRRRKNNPLLVGEAGVGKTAIAEGLASFIVNGDVPDSLSQSVIYSLDLGLLLAGTKYRGDFEKRFKKLLSELKKHPEVIIFIDEIHTLVGAGAASGSTVDASNILKPLLSRGEIRCLGSTTYEEFRTIFEKDSALSRRFQKIDVEEPSKEQTFEILRGLKRRFEEYHEVEFTIDALKAAADLSSRYMSDRHLPDKAIDVIDEAGAYQHLLPEAKRKKVIDKHEIEQVVARMARVPEQNVAFSDKARLKQLDRHLKMLVFGQDEAIDELSSAIKLSRVGLREEGKTVGSFLFAGPTGVGKTEVTKQLAHLLGVELIRFDMSEYMEPHAVSRLIGAPPGYVGYSQGGLLTEAVIKHPHAVLLLDEIEKAHVDIYNVLLQVMDYAKLTDNNGRQADFQHVILVMTTNVGAQVLDKNSIGFTRSNDIDITEGNQALKKHFTPEFRNRLDAIVQFKPLSKAVLKNVVDKFITELEVQLQSKGVDLAVDRSVRSWLAQHGYNPAMGARPMARLIQNSIKKPLSEELLDGRLTKGGRVLISLDKKEGKEELVFHYVTHSIKDKEDIV